MLDVAWFDVALEDMKFSILVHQSRNVSDSLPLNWSEIHEIVNLVIWIDDAFLGSWEVLVSEDRASLVMLVQNGVESLSVVVESTLHD